MGFAEAPRDQDVAGLPAALLVFGYAGLGAFALVTVTYPVLYLLGQVSLLTRSALNSALPAARPCSSCGKALLAAGAGLIFWSLRAIEPVRLTTTGPYARLRGPMYAGYFLAFAGVVLLTLNLPALPSLLFVPAQATVARHEEAGLAALFREDYRGYAGLAGRFLTRWRRGRGEASFK